MKQHAIDLMPASIRARTLAGLRTGRFLAATSLVVLFLAVVATHSRLHLNSAENALPMAKAEAESVFAIDARVANLRRELEGANAFIARYEKVSFPLSVSALIATVVNAMPESGRWINSMWTPARGP